MKVKKQTFKGYAVMSIGNNKHIDFYSALPQHFILKDENQTEFDRQQEAWFENNCQGKIEDY